MEVTSTTLDLQGSTIRSAEGGRFLDALELFGVERLGPYARDHRLLGALVEPLASTLDRSEELGQVHLERGEDAVSPVLDLETRLARLTPGVVDDVLGLALCEPHDLRLRRFAHRLLASLLDDPVAFPLRLREHLLPLLDDP